MKDSRFFLQKYFPGKCYITKFVSELCLLLANGSEGVCRVLVNRLDWDDTYCIIRKKENTQKATCKNGLYIGCIFERKMRRKGKEGGVG